MCKTLVSRTTMLVFMVAVIVALYAVPAAADTQTFSIVASGDDDNIETGGVQTYPPNNSPYNQTTRDIVQPYRGVLSGNWYYVANGLMAFDTSALPDNATITGASLLTDVVSKWNADGLSLTADAYNWGPQAEGTDHSHAPQTGVLSATPLSSLSVGDQQTINLENAASWVSKDGWSQIRFHITQRASDAAPTGENGIGFASWDHATKTEPKLVVTYTTGGTTTPPPPTSARLVGAGDIADIGSADIATGDLIDARPDARVFTAGDNAYPNGSASDFTNEYEPAWGPFKNRTSPSPGNHDYSTSGASGYKNYFGSVAGLRSVNPTYYAYTLGAWRVYALDSNISMARRSAQYNFVRNDLATNGALCELAYWHHPIASSGQHGNIARARPIFALFDAQGGDLVLNGHDHNYERFTKINSSGQVSASGVREIIVGTGGTGLRGQGFVQPGSEVRNFDTHGIVDINLSSTGYSGTFVPAPGFGSFTDSFSGTCGTS
jgi:hypothetical protein